MRIAFAVDTAKQDTLCTVGVGDPGYRFGLPAVDLGENGFHSRITELIIRIPPIQRAQWFIQRVARLFCFGDKAQCELVYEPGVRTRVVRRIYRFFTPLQKTLRVCECTFLLGVTSRGEEENFSLNVLWLQLATIDFGRFIPEIRGFDFNHVSYN